MSHSLAEIAQQLRDTAERARKPKKVQLIYAFNGTGKTRLSRAFKELIAPKTTEEEEVAEEETATGTKIVYYNAFTEDLFYWDNDLNGDTTRKLKIQPNAFTSWVLGEQGQDSNIVASFQHYTSRALTPIFSADYSEVSFSITRGDETNIENIKVSKGEESCFVWSIFYNLIQEIVGVLNTPEPEDRETNKFDELEYVFIDDPVSSLDDNHLIELAVHIAELIKSSESDLKFIITTHNPLFYNVLFNEFNNADNRSGYRRKHSERKRLEKLADGTYLLQEQSDDSPFSYHLYLLSELEKAITAADIRKYHFNFLRNILEKTSTFLGYQNWKTLLPQESREAYYNRIINLSSHSNHNGEEISLLNANDKRVLVFLVGEIKTLYKFNSNNT